MSLRVTTAVLLTLGVGSFQNALAQIRSIEGSYKNFALGYSIRIPGGLHGVTGDDAGPERGVKISLPSGATISVWGEPNSLEWRAPEEGVDQELTLKDCNSRERDVKPAFVGKRRGARGRLVCGDRVLILLLAFRSRGGPIYWLQLDTVRPRELEDDVVFEKLAASFSLIPWK